MNHRFDLTAPENRPDPYPIYAELRRNHPVCQVDPGGFWAISRYEDVVYVLKSHELFSSRGFQSAWEPAWVGENPLAHSLVTMDGPEHERIRGVVARTLAALLNTNFEADVRRLAKDLAERMAEGGEDDFMSGFATPLQTSVLTRILGFDAALEKKYKRWTSTVVSIRRRPTRKAGCCTLPFRPRRPKRGARSSRMNCGSPP